jgi:hypothetical protein
MPLVMPLVALYTYIIELPREDTLGPLPRLDWESATRAPTLMVVCASSFAVQGAVLRYHGAVEGKREDRRGDQRNAEQVPARGHPGRYACPFAFSPLASLIDFSLPGHRRSPLALTTPVTAIAYVFCLFMFVLPHSVDLLRHC